MVHPIFWTFKYFPSPREYMPATHSASPSRNKQRPPCMRIRLLGQSSHHQQRPAQHRTYNNPSPSPSPSPLAVFSFSFSHSHSGSPSAQRRGSSCPSQRRNQSHLHRDFVSSMKRLCSQISPKGGSSSIVFTLYACMGHWPGRP